MRVDFEIGIIGAGFAGLIAALELKRAHWESFVIFERASEVGGVWRDTVYPGCACDVPSHLYCVSSRPNHAWSSNFAGQPEILDYLRNISIQDDLRKNIRFRCEVTELRFCAQTGSWTLVDAEGQTVTLRSVILAVGPHSRPYLPALNGAESFAGCSFHSSRWDSAVDLCGKRVAVIGTGASAIQIVPNIAARVKELTVFQRSAPWVLPRLERKLSTFEHVLFRCFPITQSLVRAAVYWTMEFIGLSFVGPPMFNRMLTAVASRKLQREVRDTATRKALTPDYRAGCKRIMLSDEFYPTFNRANVLLVTEPIAKLVHNGIVTSNGAFYPVDIVIYATGYTMADPDGFLRVVGLNGRVLADEWALSGAEAYLGTTISGFPNLAMLLGPNSGLSHSSTLHVVESQMAYVLQYLAEIGRTGPGGGIDVCPNVQAAYNAELQRRLGRMIWNSGCRSSYLNRAGKNVVIFPGLTATFRRNLRRFDKEAYRMQVARSTEKV